MPRVRPCTRYGNSGAAAGSFVSSRKVFGPDGASSSVFRFGLRRHSGNSCLGGCFMLALRSSLRVRGGRSIRSPITTVLIDHLTSVGLMARQRSPVRTGEGRHDRAKRPSRAALLGSPGANSRSFFLSSRDNARHLRHGRACVVEIGVNSAVLRSRSLSPYALT